MLEPDAAPGEANFRRSINPARDSVGYRHNNFRAQVEAGLGKLQAEQGQGGIPVAPPAAVAAPPRPALVGVETVPPAQVNAMLHAERRQANQAEAEVTGAAF